MRQHVRVKSGRVRIRTQRCVKVQQEIADHGLRKPADIDEQSLHWAAFYIKFGYELNSHGKKI